MKMLVDKDESVEIEIRRIAYDPSVQAHIVVLVVEGDSRVMTIVIEDHEFEDLRRRWLAR